MNNISYAEAVHPPFHGAVNDIMGKMFEGGAGGAVSQWTTGDGKTFVAAGRSVAGLPPGAYEINLTPDRGIVFVSVGIRTEGLMRLPEENPEKVIAEFQRFWKLRERYAEFGLPYKRGVLLYGPPGSGKTCVTQICCADVVGLGGIVVRYSNSLLVKMGLRVLRMIERERPVVVVMEDIDEILASESQSEVLNLLDGGEVFDNIVFLATTNHPDRLEGRVVNRPCRFDRRFKIGMPSIPARRMYLERLVKERSGVSFDIERWVRDTAGFSMAHLQELFIAVNLFEMEYDHALEVLRSMGERLPEISEFREKGDISSILRGGCNG